MRAGVCHFCLLVQTTSVTPWQTTSVTLLTVRCLRWMEWQVWVWWTLSCNGQTLTGAGTKHSRCMRTPLVLLCSGNSNVMLLLKVTPGTSMSSGVTRWLEEWWKEPRSVWVLKNCIWCPGDKQAEHLWWTANKETKGDRTLELGRELGLHV